MYRKLRASKVRYISHLGQTQEGTRVGPKNGSAVSKTGLSRKYVVCKSTKKKFNPSVVAEK